MFKITRYQQEDSNAEFHYAYLEKKLIRTAAAWRNDFPKYSGISSRSAKTDPFLYKNRGFIMLANGVNNSHYSTSHIEYFNGTKIDWEKRLGPLYKLELWPTKAFEPVFRFQYSDIPNGMHTYLLAVGFCSLFKPKKPDFFRSKIELRECRYVPKLNKSISVPIKHKKELWMHNQIVIPFRYSGQSEKKASYDCQLLCQSNNIFQAYFTHIQLVQLK